MKKRINFLCVMLVVGFLVLLILIITGVIRNKGNASVYAKSRKAGVFGGYVNVVDVYVENSSVVVSDDTVVTLKIGIGHKKVKSYGDGSVILKISAGNCTIEGTENVFEKEYEHFYENDIYQADSKEGLFGSYSYPNLIPTYFDTFDITFPSTECSGSIHIEIIDLNNGGLGVLPEVHIYYASNGTVLYISDKRMWGIDKNNRPIYYNQKHERGFVS